jgi:hypothetical protein
VKATCRIALLLLLSSPTLTAQENARAGADANASKRDDTIRVMVVSGRAPTSSARTLAESALRARLINVFARAGEKARVIPRAETCAAMAVNHQNCDSAAQFEYLRWSAASIHASLVIWLDIDAHARRATYAPQIYVPVSDTNPWEEGWTETMVTASAARQSDALDKLSIALPALLAELPLINKCESGKALASLLPDARVLLSRRPDSELAALCIAFILHRTGTSPDSVLALSGGVLSRDPHNRIALWITATSLDSAMLMDSANVYWRKLGVAGHVVVDSSAGIIHFSLGEGQGSDGSLPRMFLSYQTTRKYSCLLPLTAEYRTKVDTISLGPFRLPNGPVYCSAAVGPAIGTREIALSAGVFVLHVVHAGNTDSYTIVVTDSTIVTAPMKTPKTTAATDSVIQRVRHE